MAARISEKTEVSVPLKNIVGLLVAVAAGTGAYFEVVERMNSLEHRVSMAMMDVKANTEFRVKWPRGELGSLPADAKQDLLIESLERRLNHVDKRLEAVDDLRVTTKLLEQKLETRK